MIKKATHYAFAWGRALTWLIMFAIIGALCYASYKHDLNVYQAEQQRHEKMMRDLNEINASLDTTIERLKKVKR